MRKQFYRDGRKVVPTNIKDLCASPITLAVWFMDDGRLDYRVRSHYAYRISTDSFTQDEVVLLQEMLLVRFGIQSTLHMSLCRGKRYPQIYVGSTGRDAFYQTVEPYILPCFRYKLPPNSCILDPSETTRRVPTLRVTSERVMI